MNNLFYLTVFAVLLAVNYGTVPVQSAPSGDSSEQFLVGRHSLNRVVRHAEPPSEDDIPPPPPQERWTDNFSRKRREAKGVGGSMPTRKG